jgi:hypothetical protein
MKYKVNECRITNRTEEALLCGLVVSSWPQIQRSRVRFPALPNFFRSSGSGSGSTEPREDN